MSTFIFGDSDYVKIKIQKTKLINNNKPHMSVQFIFHLDTGVDSLPLWLHVRQFS